jgi:hypothetical protein
MTQAFRDDLRRALAPDAALPEREFEDRLLAEVKEELSRDPQQRRSRRQRALDLETVGPRAAWVLVAAILAVVAVAALLLAGGLARSRAVPAHPGPTVTAAPVDPAVAHYRSIVDSGFAPLQQAGDDSRNACGARPTVNCRALTVRARQAAQTFLDTLNATSPPTGLQDADAEMIGGLRELTAAYDAQLAAIDSGDTSQIELRTGLSYGIKANKVYHGVADTDCWPKQTIPNEEGGLTWRCPN